MLIQTETTPNPATLKFLPGTTVMESGTRDFADAQEAEISPLAEALFMLGDVTGVFFGRDFVSVTVAPEVNWAPLKPEVVALLAEHFSAQMPLFRPGSAADIAVPGDEGGLDDDPADAAIVAQIRELIENSRSPGSGRRRRRHRLSRFRQGPCLSQDAGRLRGLPVIDRDAQARDREPAQTLRARSDRRPRGLIARDASKP